MGPERANLKTSPTLPMASVKNALSAPTALGPVPVGSDWRRGHHPESCVEKRENQASEEAMRKIWYWHDLRRTATGRTSSQKHEETSFVKPCCYTRISTHHTSPCSTLSGWLLFGRQRSLVSV